MLPQMHDLCISILSLGEFARMELIVGGLFLIARLNIGIHLMVVKHSLLARQQILRVGLMSSNLEQSNPLLIAKACSKV